VEMIKTSGLDEGGILQRILDHQVAFGN
jgi:hypothetical protein